MLAMPTKTTDLNFCRMFDTFTDLFDGALSIMAALFQVHTRVSGYAGYDTATEYVRASRTTWPSVFPSSRRLVVSPRRLSTRWWHRA